MQFTSYGRELARSEPHMVYEGPGGASAHVAACGYDTGTTVLLTGHDASGARFTRSARSVFGAYAKAQAMWGIERAWHVRDDGTRRLIFRR